MSVKRKPAATFCLQCFDTTAPSEGRAGAHERLHVENKELPRWSKALTQYRCAGVQR
jgi:hypothetical protein